jgi:hypothetical protein
MIESAFAAARGACAGVADGVCGAPPPLAGCDNAGVDGDGEGVCVACAASDAQRRVANVLARKILLMRVSSSRDGRSPTSEQVKRHFHCFLAVIDRRMVEFAGHKSRSRKTIASKIFYVVRSFVARECVLELRC